jgi:hypothetical protein
LNCSKIVCDSFEHVILCSFKDFLHVRSIRRYTMVLGRILTTADLRIIVPASQIRRYTMVLGRILTTADPRIIVPASQIRRYTMVLGWIPPSSNPYHSRSTYKYLVHVFRFSLVVHNWTPTSQNLDFPAILIHAAIIFSSDCGGAKLLWWISENMNSFCKFHLDRKRFLKLHLNRKLAPTCTQSLRKLFGKELVATSSESSLTNLLNVVSLQFSKTKFKIM